MAELKGSRVLMVVPLLAFLALCLVFQQNGKEGPWHQRCIDLWKTQQWPAIAALAENLDAIGKPDTETYFFATMASMQQESTAQTRLMATRLLRQRFINRQFETQIAREFHPQGFTEFARLRRSTFAMGILILVGILNVIALKWKHAGGWVTVLSALGCAILLI
jgi:hypothetical protein